ncbi:hypothetical protein OQA88_6013 [Cercophora sp. LCS_1]
MKPSKLPNLLGSYSMLNVTRTSNSTAPNQWGNAPTGLLVYNPNGYISVNMAATESEYRPMTISWPPNSTQPHEDWVIAAHHAMSYAGHFTIEEDNGDTGVVHHGPITVASVPSMMGTTMLRDYELIRTEEVVYLALVGTGSTIWWTKID